MQLSAQLPGAMTGVNARRLNNRLSNADRDNSDCGVMNLWRVLPGICQAATGIINILRHSRRFFRCACKALLPAAP
ncbi:hypothetical protein FXQ87_14260 [Salmonella enterica]|nr:hypothetical protein [Salmonella enterica]ECO8337986.1 hypothetical protein [Salmonella enterica]